MGRSKQRSSMWRFELRLQSFRPSITREFRVTLNEVCSRKTSSTIHRAFMWDTFTNGNLIKSCKSPHPRSGQMRRAFQHAICCTEIDFIEHD
ncbi:hypothetical protein M3Y98_01205400 [Aphelenchoides besseyi]|nr:hypothetical protein M3Y98_01205400 [Aphelenchoides besseyi]KAI6193266.1 hypothetical protein M3Y96_01000100 [Aphelenchoides besseyi]